MSGRNTFAGVAGQLLAGNQRVAGLAECTARGGRWRIASCLGWEEVQLLDWQGIRTLIALAWVAAAFLYEMGVTLDWPEVEGRVC